MGYAEAVSDRPQPPKPRLALWPRSALDELRAITGGWTLTAGFITVSATCLEPLRSRPICPECRQKLGQKLVPWLTSDRPRRLGLQLGVSGWEHAGTREIDGQRIEEIGLTKRNLRSRKWALGSRQPLSTARPTTDWRRDHVAQTPFPLPVIVECQQCSPLRLLIELPPID